MIFFIFFLYLLLFRWFELIHALINFFYFFIVLVFILVFIFIALVCHMLFKRHFLNLAAADAYFH
jgi:hypothetical protein